MCAVRNSWPKIITFLLEHSADLSAEDGDGHQALFYAVRHASIESKRVLLDAGADPNHRDKAGLTILGFFNKASGKTEELLRSHGAVK